MKRRNIRHYKMKKDNKQQNQRHRDLSPKDMVKFGAKKK
jgi:hypothetical protein